jgi:hypothetical protein
MYPETVLLLPHISYSVRSQQPAVEEHPLDPRKTT